MSKRSEENAVTGPSVKSHPSRSVLRIVDMSKAEKQTLRYCDYYCFMSLADFMAWVDAEDGTEPEISYLTGS